MALSRARLGLYVFGRLSLFNSCMEMAPVLALLTQRPTKLSLTSPVGQEKYGPETFNRRLDQPYQGNVLVEDVEDMRKIVNKLVKQLERETAERAERVM